MQVYLQVVMGKSATESFHLVTQVVHLLTAILYEAEGQIQRCND